MMRIAGKGTLIPLACFALLAAGSSGCVRENREQIPATGPASVTGPGMVQREVTPDTPKSVLDNLRGAVIQRRMSAYTNLFTSDFLFDFSPQDVNDPQRPAPARWPLADELLAAQHLFTSPQVQGITLSFTQSQAVPAFNEIPGAWKVQLSHVNMAVTLQGIGTPNVYRVVEGQATIYLKPTGTVWGSPAPRWRICRWKDGADARRGLDTRRRTREEVMSWGRIKLLFR